MLIFILRQLLTVFSILVIVHVVLSYFMSPYHPIRVFVDRIVEPVLAPIRRLVPSINMIDFSPVILLVLIQVVDFFLVQFVG
jgi:YggT family protein